MHNVVSIDGLTPMQRAFVEWFSQGLNQTQAAARAGYADPSGEAVGLMQKPAVIAAIALARQGFQEAAQITRQDIVEGMLESIDMARTMADPLTMITGFRELAKVCGHYEIKTKIEVNHTGNVKLEHLTQQTDEQLLRIIEGERVE